MCNVFPARECCVLHSGLVPLSEQRYCRHQRKKEEKGYFLYFLILIRTAYLEILKTELLRIRSWNQNEICFEHVKYQRFCEIVLKHIHETFHKFRKANT
ncbi:uncharacterized protein LOC115610462 isoform X9 [Strigops habroptila]|uniref:uncharacterized protein LOC115610462 isoform X9 n=1 Tax=Strigops habroptila TaxID=2489341 RepID=UPI0011CEFC02|nr:uncharacterized protein LOC115610462 isoform X9 [Strigops habroptila]